MRMAGLIGFFIIIALFDLPKLIKKRRWKEMIVYSAVLGLAFLLSFLHILRFDVWSLNRIITDIVRWALPS